MKDALLIIRDQLTMGYKLSFAEAMLLQQAIDVAVSQAGNSPVIPEGKQVAPIEPTEAMINAGREIDSSPLNMSPRHRVEFIYRAMLAAAPTPTRD